MLCHVLYIVHVYPWMHGRGSLHSLYSLAHQSSTLLQAMKEKKWTVVEGERQVNPRRRRRHKRWGKGLPDMRRLCRDSLPSPPHSRHSHSHARRHQYCKSYRVPSLLSKSSATVCIRTTSCHISQPTRLEFRV
jgi:hypothetical protein